MGESSRNYQNGKIYCIRNYIDDDIYVGSTTQPLSKRMAWHRNKSTTEQGRKYMKICRKMYEYGFDSFYVELIEEYPCDNVEQLHKREGEIIREWKPVLNKKVEGRTRKEYYEDNIEKIKDDRKQYYQENKDKILEYHKQYREDNKEYLQEYDKQRNETRKEYRQEYNQQYYNENRERILAQEKMYRENNKDKFKQKDKTYYDNNKDKILAKQAVKCLCECGSHYTHNHKARHLKTKKHIAFIENK